jgi:hypothetical protein
VSFILAPVKTTAVDSSQPPEGCQFALKPP